MKILIVNHFETSGGAAKAAKRLHRSLLREGINSNLLVSEKNTDDYTVFAPETLFMRIIVKIKAFFDQFLLRNYNVQSYFSPSIIPSFGIIDLINAQNADIVHLHWVQAGMLSINDFKKIKSPIVWTLHDNWAFTGGCHVMWECEKYKDRCSECPRLQSNSKNDISRKIFKRKEIIYPQISNITIIGLSKWLANCAKHSTLLKDKNIINLPNPIDTNIFKPFDKQSARELWNLPKDKRLILFGAMSATSSINKGFKQLSEAINNLENQNIEFVVFGSSKPKEDDGFKFKTHYLGYINDDVSLVSIYNACDVMVVPSLQENLSNAIMESLSCGTPVVAFDIGGNSDMITHKENGYLAKAYNATELKKGIEWVLNFSKYENISKQARRMVVDKFDNKIVAKKYISMYHNILSK